MQSLTDNPRARSGQTKKSRTREALLKAAHSRFADLGWDGTRMEDVAHDAMVSTASAYNHFSKQTLIGYVYAPLFRPLLDHAAADIAADRDPVDSITRHVDELAEIACRHRNLTIALLRAVQDRTLVTAQTSRADDRDDVRVIVPAPRPMAQLADYGRRVGRFSFSLSADELASYHTNAALLHLLTRPGQTAAESAHIILSQLLPAVGVGSP